MFSLTLGDRVSTFVKDGYSKNYLCVEKMCY